VTDTALRIEQLHASMVGKKPVVLLIHGAWQSIDQYAALKGLLEQAGLTVHLTANATSGPDASKIRGKTHLDDVARIHAAMEEPLAQGLEIILVCHSYGGVPATVAVENYQIPERQERGLPGGVRHVVYLAAFALPQRGASLLAGLGGQYAPFMSLEVRALATSDLLRMRQVVDN
jgi:pimeloyl-ACP methyl ester carboxylesterase